MIYFLIKQIITALKTGKGKYSLPYYPLFNRL